MSVRILRVFQLLLLLVAFSACFPVPSSWILQVPYTFFSFGDSEITLTAGNVTKTEKFFTVYPAASGEVLATVQYTFLPAGDLDLSFVNIGFLAGDATQAAGNFTLPGLWYGVGASIVIAVLPNPIRTPTFSCNGPMCGYDNEVPAYFVAWLAQQCSGQFAFSTVSSSRNNQTYLLLSGSNIFGAKAAPLALTTGQH
jgi:hypothetical protein